MYKFLTKHGQSAALALGVLILLIFLGSIISGFGGSAYDMSTDLTKLTPDQRTDIGFFDSGIAFAVILGALAFGLAFVVFGIMDLIKFPKSAVKFLIGFLVLAIIFFALYSTSSVESVLAEAHSEFDVSDKVSKMISGGIKTTLGLMILGVLGIIVGEIYSMFK